MSSRCVHEDDHDVDMVTFCDPSFFFLRSRAGVVKSRLARMIEEV